MTDTTRCEPPEELRGVDGWHWVVEHGLPHLARWHVSDNPETEPLWTSTHHVYPGTPRYAAREWEWRYLAPVATPAEVEALRAEVARMKAAASTINEEVCQTLGKALGYPWFKDDLANFPGSTEAHGVCVGDHVAESIAAEAAERITALRAEVERLRAALETIKVAVQTGMPEYNLDDVEDMARSALAKEPPNE